MSHLLTIAAQHAHGGGESFQAELTELLRNPAHWVFEWINDLVSWIFIASIGRFYVKHRERKAVASATPGIIQEHDARFHPHSHSKPLDTDDDPVVG